MEGVYVDKKVARTSTRTGKVRSTAVTLLLATCGIFILYLIGGQVWQEIMHRLVKLDFLTEVKFNLVTTAECILIKEETLLTAPRSGKFSLLAEEGLKVKAGYAVGKISSAAGSQGGGEVLLRSPRGGLVCTHLDGLENILKTAHIDVLDMDGLRKILNSENNKTGSVENGSPVLKILDNLAPLRVYLEAGAGSLPGQTVKGSSLTLLWQGREIKGRVEDIKTSAGKVRLIILVNNYPDDILHARMVTLDLVRDRVSGFRVPSSSLVDNNGRKGIYIADKRRAVWAPVEIQGSDREYSVVTGPELGPETRYVINPRWVRAGDRVE